MPAPWPPPSSARRLWLPRPAALAGDDPVGALAGAAWALLPALLAHPLQGRRRRHHPAAQFRSCSTACRRCSKGRGRIRAAAIPTRRPSAPRPSSRSSPAPQLHLGVLLALLAVLVVWFVMGRTTLGFAIRAVGENRGPPPMPASPTAGSSSPPRSLRRARRARRRRRGRRRPLPGDLRPLVRLRLCRHRHRQLAGSIRSASCRPRSSSPSSSPAPAACRARPACRSTWPT